MIPIHDFNQSALQFISQSFQIAFTHFIEFVPDNP